MTADPWHTERLDLDGYLDRVGVAAREPGREALDELHEAHVRAFTFDNIDVLLGQHPGVSLDAVDGKFVGRGRGGYCFEHATIFAAALERLGYDVRRRLSRVGDPAGGAVQGRTHLVVEVRCDRQPLLCDPGFGISLRGALVATAGRRRAGGLVAGAARRPHGHHTSSGGQAAAAAKPFYATRPPQPRRPQVTARGGRGL